MVKTDSQEEVGEENSDHYVWIDVRCSGDWLIDWLMYCKKQTFVAFLQYEKQENNNK